MSNISMPNGITKGRAMSCCSLGVEQSAAPGLFNAASDWAACCVITIGRQRNGVPANGAQTETKSGKQMRIKDAREGLHTLLHTQGLDGLLHLYKRLEKKGRPAVVPVMCRGWMANFGKRLAAAG